MVYYQLVAKKSLKDHEVVEDEDHPQSPQEKTEPILSQVEWNEYNNQPQKVLI